jgi:hypothetical protein
MDSRSTISLHFGLLALGALVAGCNNAAPKALTTDAASDGPAEVTDSGPRADGAAETGPSDAAGTTDAAGTPDAAVNPDGAGAGESCSSEKACAGALFCDLPLPLGVGGCGKRFVTGKCIARPTTCPAGGAPVCGCDGMTYQNDCLRQKAAVPIAFMAACQGWQTGPISCGAMTCAPAQLCVRPGSQCGTPPPCTPAPDGGPCPAGLVSCNGPGGPGCTYGCSPPSPYCLDVPASCHGLPTCACLQTNDCSCEGISMGREVVCSGAP